jgi:hypothetical protein
MRAGGRTPASASFEVRAAAVLADMFTARGTTAMSFDGFGWATRRGKGAIGSVCSRGLKPL